MREELNKRQVGGDTFQANDVLEEMSKVHERMMEVMRLQTFNNGSNDQRHSINNNDLDTAV